MDSADGIWSSGESEPDEAAEVDHVPDPPEIEYDGPRSDYRNNYLFYDSSFNPSVKDFAGEFKIREDATLADRTPLHYFQLFFDSPLLKLIARETNRYQKQHPESTRSKMKSWIPVTQEELQTFLGLSILMGHVRKVNFKDYWSTDPLLSTPIFRESMTRNRYLQILHYLHFVNNKDSTDHPVKKIKPVMDDLRAKFSKTISPGKNLCVDENFVQWRGRLKFKQYSPLKRYQNGIKIFELTDCESGYLLDFMVHSGRACAKLDLGSGGDVVAHIARPYFNRGHVIYTGHGYASPALAEYLYDYDTGLCGTAYKHGKGMPTKLRSQLNRGEIEAAHTDAWLVVRWLNKEEVFVITTVHKVEFCHTGNTQWKTRQDLLQPTCVRDYNKNVNHSGDRRSFRTETLIKSIMWYRKLFFHFVDLALNNAYILYKKKNQVNLAFPHFRLRVVRELLKLDDSDFAVQPSDARLLGGHFPKKIDTNKTNQCVKCTMDNVRSRSRYICSKCNVALCIVPCFEIYHTKESLP